jgi:hypothetical protein
VRLLSRFSNRRLSAAYRRVFGAPSAEVVLGDLGDFCRAREAPFVAGDAMATGVLIGRQEVFHRIARYLNPTGSCATADECSWAKRIITDPADIMIRSTKAQIVAHNRKVTAFCR